MPANDLLRAVAAKRRNFADALRRTHRRDGAVAAARLAARWVAEGALRPVTNLRQRRFDRRFGVDTGRDHGAWVGVPTEVAAAARFADSSPYAPTPAPQFRRLLRSLPLADPAGYSLLDLGCGKGLTLLLAAQHGFRAVVGVELDARLVEVARANVRTFEAGNPRYAGRIEVRHGDAATVELPDGPTVVFLFNSFGPDTLRLVCANIQRSLARAPRPALLAYYNPVHRDLLDAHPGFRRVAATTRWAVFDAASPS
ncbi:MAG TPA: class I SAM-dependent methyltransferase [Pilimelia sp.]|nr:class I SAM-dependent methyltransferase [Pilimelia sp.]